MRWDSAAAEAAMERLERIPWEPGPPDAASSLFLMREYLRRAALWAEALQCPDRWPFFDVAAQAVRRDGGDAGRLPGHSLLAPEPDYAEGSDALEERVRDLWRHLTGLSLGAGGLHAHICLWSVRFVAAQGTPSIAQSPLPPPYEPLIVLYGRGQWFRREQGIIDFDAGGIMPGRWDRHAQQAPVTALDTATLDRLDEADRARRAQERARRAGGG